MAKAAAAGHRVVLVCATKGEVGEPQPGVLSDGEELWQRRMVELAESCAILGADEPRYLGYEDSGMVDEETNNNPACFWQADVDEAAERMASILREVDADVLTVYDAHGLYGHPDHIQVHRVGLRAAELAAIENVYLSTVNRDAAIASFAEVAELAAANGEADDAPDAADFEEFGMLEKDLAYTIDVSDVVATKRKAIAVHRSQVGEDSFFLKMPEEIFIKMFGSEDYALPGQTDTGGPVAVELLPGL